MRISRPGNSTLIPGAVSGKGFSLLELMVVLALMALVAAVVVPAFNRGLDGLRLETEARNLVVRFKEARSQAIALQEVRRVTLSTETEMGYAITDDYGSELKTVKLPEGIQLGLEEGAEKRVTFYPNGRSSGYSLTLFNSRQRRMIVVVDPISGLARARRPTEDDS